MLESSNSGFQRELPAQSKVCALHPVCGVQIVQGAVVWTVQPPLSSSVKVGYVLRTQTRPPQSADWSAFSLQKIKVVVVVDDDDPFASIGVTGNPVPSNS
jgi:hypothetical protein